MPPPPRRVLVGSLLWLLLLFCGAAPAQAQDRGDEPTGAVGGFITDAGNGQSLTGATVVLRRLPDTTASYGEATDQDGLYLISDLPPGR
ncbi:MAG: carboxypeptidase-like regulatory domain-containing protein, partial [Salinivenus sp.]